jgi:predicted metal-dependent hydrolase
MSFNFFKFLISTSEKEKAIKTLPFTYTIRRSQRAKKARIIVTTEKIEVVAPLRVSTSKIHAFVVSRQDWVIGATDKIGKKQKLKKLAPEQYIDGASVPFRGQQMRLKLKPTSSNKVKIELLEQELIILFPHQWTGDKNSKLIQHTLIDWMKQQAIGAVQSCVAIHAHKYKLNPRKIRIKSQKSRWGSCGIHNDINLNWLLILAPPDVLEYVVVHELCHIKERNHSAQFWQLVEAHLPDYKKARKWLKQNGGSLMQGL